MIPEEKKNSSENFVNTNYTDSSKKTNTELENEIIRYLMEKIQSERFNLKDLSFDGLTKQFNMKSESDKKRLKSLLEGLIGIKLLKRKSGIEIYIPIEVKNHLNIINLKPEHLYKMVIQYIIGFVILILIFEVPYLAQYLNSLIIGLFNNQSAIPLIVLSAAIGFFLPLAIGIGIYKLYFYILLVKPNINLKLLILLASSVVICIFLYVLSIYLLNAIYQVDNMPTAEGIFAAIAVGIGFVALPQLSKLIKKKNDKDKEDEKRG